MDKYIIEFSREPNEARKIEITSIMETYGDFEIEYMDDYIAIIEGNPSHLKNSAFINFISKIIYKCDNIEDLKNAKVPDGKFYLRIGGEYSNREITERLIGSILNGKGRISFSNPDFVLRAIYKDAWYLSIVYFRRDTKSFESRKAPLRPYFSPVSMHPKYARFLVNTAHVREGETLLDPFCGTGGVLIEAAMIGIRIVGNDISLNMTIGTKMNLKFFKINDFKIYNDEISNLETEQVDGIATDMPYGRGSYIDDDVNGFYEKSFSKFNELLKNKRYASFAISNKLYIETARKYFDILSVVPVYQHRALTRYFVTARKK